MILPGVGPARMDYAEVAGTDYITSREIIWSGRALSIHSFIRKKFITNQ
jgi:hypothetical protein